MPARMATLLKRNVPGVPIAGAPSAESVTLTRARTPESPTSTTARVYGEARLGTGMWTVVVVYTVPVRGNGTISVSASSPQTRQRCRGGNANVAQVRQRAASQRTLGSNARSYAVKASLMSGPGAERVTGSGRAGVSSRITVTPAGSHETA